MDKEIEEGIEIFQEQVLLSKGDWEKIICPNCKTENWFNWDIDYMAEVCICYVCHEEFWLDTNTPDLYDGNINLVDDKHKQKGRKSLTD